MTRGNFKRTPETLKKMGLASLGNQHARGYKHTKKARETMRQKALGRKWTPEKRLKMELYHKTHPSPMKNKKHSKKTRLKMSQSHLGVKYPESRKQQMRIYLKGINKGEKNHMWKGGEKPNPYPEEWRELLREQVRNRDGRKCQLCGIPEIECLRKLDVHHIDYDKNNNKIYNLISLCVSCHVKTNYDRTKWRKYYEAIRDAILTLTPLKDVDL